MKRALKSIANTLKKLRFSRMSLSYKNILPIVSVLFCINLNAQVEGLIVEKYYISNENDALYASPVIPTLKVPLEVGSVTYRVYIDLPEGHKLLSVYSDVNHPLEITSTMNFFNFDMFGPTYGYQANKALFSFGTFPLDSWLTVGLATSAHLGVPKIDDADGSIVGGANSAGMLTNYVDAMEVPLSTADGLINISSNSAYSAAKLSVIGEPAIINTILKDKTSGASVIINNNFKLTYTGGIVGLTAENKILVAQLTTKGDLSLKLNIVVQSDDYKTDKNLSGIVRLVADKTILVQENFEQFSNNLSYPPQCGCTNPYFVEFDPTAVCDDGSCNDSIVLGCMDTEACNFDPNANFNVIELCCYGPNDCGKRDIKIVCPNYNEDPQINGNINKEIGITPTQEANYVVYPNPFEDVLTIKMTGKCTMESFIKIFDSSGRVVLIESIPLESDLSTHQINLSNLEKGIYVLYLNVNGEASVNKVYKK